MKNLLESGQERFAGPPFSAGRILMGTDNRAVGDRSDLIDLSLLEVSEDRRPVAFLRPATEPVVDRLPRSKSFRQIAPWNARLRSVQDRVDEEAIAALRIGASLRFRNRRLEERPLLVGESVSMHSQHRSRSGSRDNPFCYDVSEAIEINTISIEETRDAP